MNQQRQSQPSSAEESHRNGGPRVDPLTWIGEVGAQDDILRAMDRQSRRQRRIRARALLGGLAVILIGGFFWRSGTLREPVNAPPPLSAVVIPPVRQVLPDATIVELNRGAEIEVKFSEDVRRVMLVRGEAHFQVTKDPARPFVVGAGGVDVRAVGTAFSVQRGATMIEVLVTEGRVSLDETTPSPAHGAGGANQPIAQSMAFLDAGKRAMIEIAAARPIGSPKVEELSANQLSARLAWRVPQLDLSATPLAEAITMIERYSPVRLTLADPGLGNLRFSGVLRADNIETLLELLKEEHGIIADHRSKTDIVLSKAR